MAKQLITARLEDEVIAQIDATCAKFSMPWHAATRSDAMRALILLGLEQLEDVAETPPQPKSTIKKRSDKKKRREG